MKKLVLALSLFATSSGAIADDNFFKRDNLPIRPAHTYSIVAHDPATGEFGAAVQSHWFSVGSDVIWAEPGIGAVATQSFIEVSYGPNGLALMRDGVSAADALKSLISKDENENVRQVAMIDAKGSVANHTGSKAIIASCDQLGDTFSVQANLMEKDTVCAAMATAFKATKGDLAGRMMVALEAAQGEGGDIRGKQSAALLVVKGEKGTPLWKGRAFDLRVDDHATPIKELKRLLYVARTYNKMNEGDNFMTNGNIDAALEAYAEAERMMPNNYEALFWHAVTLASIERVEESLPLFKKAFDLHPQLRDLIPRFPHSGLLPDDDALIAEIVGIK